MAHIADTVRAPASCDGCGNIYTVRIWSDGKIQPVGVPKCRGCGGDEFTVYGKAGAKSPSSAL